MTVDECHKEYLQVDFCLYYMKLRMPVRTNQSLALKEAKNDCEMEVEGGGTRCYNAIGNAG
jgi:hypothetical protein